jgi:NADPH-dependent 2,4-dienoyl-CoA reductase/sulfur reductase-like enzyme
MRTDLLIIGGGPAALSAAIGYREAGGQGTVLLASDEQTPPYFRPPLSKDYLRGETDEDDLALQPQSGYAEKSIDIRLGSTVRELDPGRRRAVVADGTPVDYGSCVLATGAEPNVLPVPGADDPEVYSLRSLYSARRLRSAATAAASAVVIGSGFIGCEAASSLARRGLQVTVVSTEQLPQQDRLGPELGQRFADWLREDGVEFIGGVSVGQIEHGQRVVLDDDESVVTGDLVLVAAGVRPRADLAEAAGAAMQQNRVVVDQHMRSNIPGLLAAGDVAFAHNAAAGRHLVVEHWGEAQTMGAIAGATVAGGDASWENAPGFWTTIGDHTLKYSAWGDGYEQATLIDHGPATDSADEAGSFTVWYSTNGITVGVATHRADADYERGGKLVEQAQPAPAR